jgi:hypothetical protein
VSCVSHPIKSDVHSSALVWHRFLATTAVVCAFNLALGAALSYGETYPATVVAAPPINTDTSSCNALKSALQNSGALTLVSGLRGWGDTYYARVPRCQFWQRPLFAYVTANDGLCGVGYICTDKLSGS